MGEFNFEVEEKIISSGTVEGKQANIIHIENMQKDKDYPILIKGEKFVLRKSDIFHLWIFQK